ncbi:MAG TPA: hypothetical protein VKH19_02645 [Gemmatimonadaceae bacterium]|nr:hypothetical protein [Gemmatimonadaceae bacterium]
MRRSRQFAYGLVACTAAACARQPSTTPQPQLEGPKAYVHATYQGGIINRQTEAVFKVDEGAYVMVAHLGGDGRITVLYPEDSRESGRVPAGKWFRTDMVSAYYDAAPQLYSFAMLSHRSYGAQLDSYDGGGYGYIFLVASKRPLRFDRISEFGLWNDLAISDYRLASDPRIYIRALASEMAGDRPYTLKFARSISSTSLTSYSDMLFDCAYLSELAFSSLWAPYNYANFLSPSLAFPGARGGCGQRSSYAFGFYRPVVLTTAAAPTDGPKTPSAPREGTTLRPRRKAFDNPRSGFSFATPLRHNSPDQPAAAPHDRSYLWRSGFGATPGSDGRHYFPGDRASSGSSSSSSRSGGTTPARAAEQRAVVQRAEGTPAKQPTTSSQPQPKQEERKP